MANKTIQCVLLIVKIRNSVKNFPKINTVLGFILVITAFVNACRQKNIESPQTRFRFNCDEPFGSLPVQLVFFGYLCKILIDCIDF